MAAPKFYGAKLEDMTLTATSTDAAYPLANLQTYDPDDLWKSDSTAANQVLVIDFGAARSCDFVAIAGHNFEALTCDIGLKLQGADDSGFSTNLVTAVLDLQASTDPNIVEFNAVSKRYWRLYFNSAGALGAKPELGQIFLGTKLAWTSDPEYPYGPAHSSYQSSEAVSLSGKLVSAQSVAGRLIFDYSFKLQDDTLKAAWYTFMQTIRGRLRPFYMLDLDGSSIYYVKLDSDYLPGNVPLYGRSDYANVKLKTVFASW